MLNIQQMLKELQDSLNRIEKKIDTSHDITELREMIKNMDNLLTGQPIAQEPPKQYQPIVRKQLPELVIIEPLPKVGQKRKKEDESVTTRTTYPFDAFCRDYCKKHNITFQEAIESDICQNEWRAMIKKYPKNYSKDEKTPKRPYTYRQNNGWLNFVEKWASSHGMKKGQAITNEQCRKEYYLEKNSQQQDEK